MIDMVCYHPPIPKASDLLIPLLPDEEPSLDKAVQLIEQLKEKGIYCSSSFLLDVWQRKQSMKGE